MCRDVSESPSSLTAPEQYSSPLTVIMYMYGRWRAVSSRSGLCCSLVRTVSSVIVVSFSRWMQRFAACGLPCLCEDECKTLFRPKALVLVVVPTLFTAY